jgi:hypothetical protein
MMKDNDRGGEWQNVHPMERQKKTRKRREKGAIHKNHIQKMVAGQRRIKSTRESSEREMMQIELCINRKDGDRIEARVTNSKGDGRRAYVEKPKESTSGES